MKLYLIIICFLLSFRLFAQVWTPPGAHLKPSKSLFTLDIGANQFDNDYYLYVAPGFNYQYESIWGLSMQLPLNLLVKDNEPYMQKSHLGMIRTIDYANPKNYQRLLNHFWLGDYGRYEPGKVTGSLYVGNMFNGSIGHGTIINRYINNPRLEIYKLGVMADINTDYGGVQVFTNSVADREVNAGRAYIRPYGIIAGAYYAFMGNPDPSAMLMIGNVIDESGRKKVYEEVEPETERIVEEIKDPNTGEITKVEKEVPKEPKKAEVVLPTPSGFNPNSLWNRFSIGFTSAVDGRAPNQLNFDGTGKIQFDKYYTPTVRSSKRVGIIGVDVEFLAFNHRMLKITPYADFNRIRKIDNAKGEHYGIDILIGGRDINLNIKPEFRRMTSTYIPNYFDSFYEIERFQIDLDTGFPQTKYEYLSEKEAFGKQLKGYNHTVLLNIYDFTLEANYEDYSGPNNARVFLGAYLPIMNFILISGYYTKKGFDVIGEAFQPDNRAQGAAEIGISLGPIMVRAQNRRSWVFAQSTNRYKALDEKMILFSGGRNF